MSVVSDAQTMAGFTMIQVWQAEYPPTVIRLDSRFAHDDGLPEHPSSGDEADTNLLFELCTFT